MAQRYAKLLSRTCGNNRNFCTIFRPAAKISPTNGPRFGVQKRTPKRGPSRPDTSKSNWLNEWPPFCPFLDGCRFVGKILVTGRKTARVSIVSAGTRQKFSTPLLFHGFAAPQALVRQALRTFMATHVLELGRPSVAGPVFARVFGHQTGVQKNHFFRSLEGAKSLENL